MRWGKKVIPWVTVISLIVNLYFVQLFWQNQTHANRYLWGNMTGYLIAGVTWAENGMDPEARVALTTLDLMRSLPRYEQRVERDHFLVIEQFLRSASAIQIKAAREREQSGMHTEETARRLAQMRRGFALLQEHLHRVNELQKEVYALNDGAWRAMWADIALGLNKIDLD
ncbi:MAG: hypothetical protein ACOY94_03370 [Bacillota bacterium]